MEKARHRPCWQSFQGRIRRQISVNIGKLQGDIPPFEAHFDDDDDDEQVGEDTPAFAKNAMLLDYSGAKAHSVVCCVVFMAGLSVGRWRKIWGRFFTRLTFGRKEAHYAAR
jgi:hypothetical protein